MSQKSTNALKQEVLTICGELTDGSSPFDAQVVSYLDKVHQGLIAGNNLFDISCDQPWIWAQSRTPIILTLTPAVSGNATFTSGATSGVFSIAPTISLEGRHLFIQGYSDVYRITNHQAGDVNFSLDQSFLGATGAIPFNAVKYDYDAFSDVVIVNSKNCAVDFSEGGVPLVAMLTRGTYTPSALCTEISSKMTAASGVNIYVVTFNSITRKFTFVQGGATFTLLFGSGPNAYISASEILGFDIEDKLGSISYSSDYALSGITRISKPITVYQNSPYSDESARDANKIFMIDDNTFLRDYPINRLSSSLPDKFCPIEQGPDGLWKLRFNASVQKETRAEINHIPVARKLTDNVHSYPLVPGSFCDFLVYGAAHFVQVDKSDSKAADSSAKAIAQLKALIAFNQQGSQIAGNNVGRIIARPGQNRRILGSGGVY